jgi:hypothetical protein
MRHRLFIIIGAVAGAITAAGLMPAHVAGQAPASATKAAKPSRASSVPRTADGHPDLQGIYDLATLTPLERPAGTAAVLSDEEAAKLEKEIARQREHGAAPIKGDRDAPPKGGDGSVGPAGNVGGYNTFWLDPGSQYTRIAGRKRTSIIVDPPDGRVPPVTPEARQRNAARVVRTTSDQVVRENDPGFEGGGAYDDPERRPLGERCLLGFSSTSGPPVLPNYFYNNLHQIVQTPDSVMILTEMVHDARIVRMGGQHLSKHIRKWMGDSVGHWDGDTLVVDTTNFTDKTRFRGSSENLHVVERFSRVDADTLLYRFTIDDPATWARPFTGEYTWPATQERLYEYACHEGNYALGDILRGARLKEAEDANIKKK